MLTSLNTLLRSRRILPKLFGAGVVLCCATVQADPKIGVYPKISGGAASYYTREYEAWLGRPMDYINQTIPFQSFVGTSFLSRGGTGSANRNSYVNQIYGFGSGFTSRVVLAVGMLPNPNTINATLAQGAAGTYDSYWADFADDLIETGMGNAVIRLGWELNGGWFPWSANPRWGAYQNPQQPIDSTRPQKYIDYWRKIVQTMRSRSGAHFKFCWNVANQDPNQMGNPQAAFPGAAYVDMIGIDVYDTSSGYDSAYQAHYDRILASPPLSGTLTSTQVNSYQLNGFNSQGFASTTGYGPGWWSVQVRTSTSPFYNIPLCFPEWGLVTPADWNTGSPPGGRDDNGMIYRFKGWINDPNNHVDWAAYFEGGDMLDANGPDILNSIIAYSKQYPASRVSFRRHFGGANARSAVADAYVRDGTNATINYGDSDVMEVKLDAANYQRQAFLRFDVNGLSAASSVKLRLTTTGAGAGQASTTFAFDVMTNDSWGEYVGPGISNVLNWNNRPTAVGTTGPLKTGGFVAGQSFDIDLTAPARSNAVSGDGYMTVRIRSTTTGSDKNVSFAAQENDTIEYRPSLVIVP